MIPGVPGSSLPVTIAIPKVPGSVSDAAESNVAAPGFSDFLSQALDQANQLSTSADTLSAQYAAGGPVSVDSMMIAEQKASLALDLVVQVRDRVVSAYQSVMNMQI
jgi:flagellar hook-basal body complex protein FliE